MSIYSKIVSTWMTTSTQKYEEGSNAVIKSAFFRLNWACVFVFNLNSSHMIIFLFQTELVKHISSREQACSSSVALQKLY